MRLNDVGTRFQQTLKTITGKQFHGLVCSGLLAAPADYALRVSGDSVLNLGDVVIYDDDKYLIAFGRTESQGSVMFRLMQMIFVTHELAWTRSIEALDPVSQLAKQIGADDLGTAYASVSPSGLFFDVFKSQNSKYHFITTSPVLVKDRVGDFTITFVSFQYGIWFCEAR